MPEFSGPQDSITIPGTGRQPPRDTPTQDSPPTGPGPVPGAGGGPPGGVAFMSSEGYGPLKIGSKNDKHKYGETPDGEPIMSGHLSHKSFFHESEEFDAPLEFQLRYYEKPGRFPLDSPVHLVYDPKETHEWEGEQKPGLWRWYCEVPEMPTRVPRDKDIPKDGEIPPTETPPTITPGDDPTPEGPVTPTPGGGEAQPVDPGDGREDDGGPPVSGGEPGSGNVPGGNQGPPLANGGRPDETGQYHDTEGNPVYPNDPRHPHYDPERWGPNGGSAPGGGGGNMPGNSGGSAGGGAGAGEGGGAGDGGAPGASLGGGDGGGGQGDDNEHPTRLGGLSDADKRARALATALYGPQTTNQYGNKNWVVRNGQIFVRQGSVYVRPANLRGPSKNNNVPLPTNRDQPVQKD